jgi:hypothetical protein
MAARLRHRATSLYSQHKAFAAESPSGEAIRATRKLTKADVMRVSAAAASLRARSAAARVPVRARATARGEYARSASTALQLSPQRAAERRS